MGRAPPRFACLAVNCDTAPTHGHPHARESPMPKRPENLYDRYHAHVYFDESTEDQARALCIDAWRGCHVGLGRFHLRPIGPHPRWSCQLSFDAGEFDRLIAWLDAHRDGLDILVHPLTDDALEEHTSLAAWLGKEVALSVEVFKPEPDDA